MQKISVSTLVKYLKNKLDSDNNIQKIMVTGEISNFHRHLSGHLYFTLKDEGAAISCVMFKTAAALLNFEPKNGDSVLICANTSLFVNTGQLQLYVLNMSIDGIGDLYAKYEALKAKLNNEGIFAQDHKISLTKKYIESVAVLVGDKSAAMSDIKTTFLRRWPLCKVDFYSVLVQGNDAPNSIIEALNKVDKLGYDAILLCRGGGSFEDLFCFNDEELVRTIYSLKTFIVTGVGHEQDFTLVDFVSDLRAPTPTAAVELVTPNIIDIKNNINDFKNKLNINIENKLNNTMHELDYLYQKLSKYINRFKEINNQINIDIERIKYLIINKLDKYKLNLKRYETLLNAYGYQNTLQRGYSLVMQDNKVIKSYKDINDEEFQIYFYDGNIKAIKR